MNLLELKNVSVLYSDCKVVNDVSLSLETGETLGIAGASGCGKSTLAKAILGILPESASVSGSIKYCGQEIVGMTEKEFFKLRGSEISMVFQDPDATLNPVRKIKHQFYDIFNTHRFERAKAEKDIIHFLNHVHLENPQQLLDKYPPELSGGMKQRIVIAMAICKQPELLIADEPTSALDASIRLQIIDEIISLKKRLGFSMVYISHNLAELGKVSDKIMVMKDGIMVEYGKADRLFSAPVHPYTKELLAAANGE